MKKGLKKFTVPYSGTYFDGGRIYGPSMTAMMNPLHMPARLPSGFAAKLATAKYTLIGNSKINYL